MKLRFIMITDAVIHFRDVILICLGFTAFFLLLFLEAESFVKGPVFRVQVVGLDQSGRPSYIAARGSGLVVKFGNGWRTVAGRERVFGYRQNQFGCVTEYKGQLLGFTMYRFMGYEKDDKCPKMYPEPKNPPA